MTDYNPDGTINENRKEYKPMAIHNPTCRLCKKKEGCYEYKFFGYILCTSPKFVESTDHDDFFLHLGELCKKHEFIEGQEG